MLLKHKKCPKTKKIASSPLSKNLRLGDNSKQLSPLKSIHKQKVSFALFFLPLPLTKKRFGGGDEVRSTPKDYLYLFLHTNPPINKKVSFTPPRFAPSSNQKKYFWEGQVRPTPTVYPTKKLGLEDYI